MVTKYQAVPPPFYIYFTEKMYKIFLFFPCKDSTKLKAEQIAECLQGKIALLYTLFKNSLHQDHIQYGAHAYT